MSSPFTDDNLPQIFEKWHGNSSHIFNAKTLTDATIFFDTWTNPVGNINMPDGENIPCSQIHENIYFSFSKLGYEKKFDENTISEKKGFVPIVFKNDTYIVTLIYVDGIFAFCLIMKRYSIKFETHIKNGGNTWLLEYHFDQYPEIILKIENVLFQNEKSKIVKTMNHFNLDSMVLIGEKNDKKHCYQACFDLIHFPGGNGKLLFSNDFSQIFFK